MGGSCCPIYRHRVASLLDDIAGEPEKIENRCRTQERIGVDAKGREVRASIACKGVCRESCEGC